MQILRLSLYALASLFFSVVSPICSNAQSSSDIIISPVRTIKLCQYSSSTSDSILLNLSNISSEVVTSLVLGGTIDGAPYGPHLWQGTIPPYGSNQVLLPAFLEFVADSTTVTLLVHKINGSSLSEYDSVSFQVYTGSGNKLDPIADHSICLGQSAFIEVPIGFDKYIWSDGDTLHKNQVSQPGEYFLTVVDEFGCIQTDTFSVSHFNYPQSILNSTYSYCEGQSATLSVDSNFVSVSWSNGSVNNQQNLHQGIYNVSVTDTNGCDYAAHTMVNELPLPISSLENHFETCADSPVELNAGNHNLVVWNQNDTTQRLTVANTGWYSVSIWNVDGCSIQDSTFVQVHPVPNVMVSGDSVICNDASVTLRAIGSTGIYSWNQSTQSGREIQITNPGKYIVKVVDANGCQKSADYIVSKEVVSIQPMNDTIICDGDAIQLNAKTEVDNNLLWPDGTNTSEYQISRGGSYIVRALSNHCSVADTIEVIQKYAPTSEFVYNVIDGEVQFNQVNNSANSYLWSFGDSTTAVESDPVHEYSRIGAYEVILTTSNVCGISSTKRTVQIGSLGITELNREGILTVYPNPVNNGILNVMFNKWSGRVNLNLYNTLGQLIYTRATNVSETHSIAIPVNQVQSGIYFLEVELPDQRIVEQLFVD